MFCELNGVTQTSALSRQVQMRLCSSRLTPNSAQQFTPDNLQSETKPSSSCRGKYSELYEFFQRCEDLEVCLSFSQLDSLVGILPKSAQTYREWWANHKSNPQAVWLASGYRVVEVSFGTAQVSFSR